MPNLNFYSANGDRLSDEEIVTQLKIRAGHELALREKLEQLTTAPSVNPPYPLNRLMRAALNVNRASYDPDSGVLTLKYDGDPQFLPTTVDFVEVGHMVEAVARGFGHFISRAPQARNEVRSAIGQIIAEALDAKSLDEYPGV